MGTSRRFRLEDRPASAPGRGRALRAALLVFTVILSAAVVLLAFSVAGGNREARSELESDGAAAERAVTGMINVASDRLVAVSGLFRSSEMVTEDEFRSFVRDIGLGGVMDGIAFAAVVPAELKDPFILAQSALLERFEPFEIDDEANPQPLTERDTYYFVTLVEPPVPYGYMTGIDAGSHPLPAEAIRKAAATGETKATEMFQFPGQPDADNFLLIQPIAVDGDLIGLAVGWMDLSDMLESQVPAQDLERWRITDVTNGPVAATAPYVTTLDIVGRRWQLEVDSASAAAGWTMVHHVGLGLSVVAAVVAGVLTFLVMQRYHTRREYQRLRDLSEQKDRLLAMVSHELRTPLTGVVGFLGELHDHWDEMSPEQRADYLSIASDEAGEMGALVDDLLVGARIGTASPLSVGSEAIDLPTVLQQVFAQVPRAKGVPIEVVGGGVALGDPIRTRQVLRNLVDNSIKHGRAPVRVDITADDSWVWLRVADAGQGVPDCCRELIFHPDPPPLDHGHPTATDSNGLGLPVSLYLAQLMRGDLRYLPGPNAFEFVLPAAPARARAAETVVALPDHPPAELLDDEGAPALAAEERA